MRFKTGLFVYNANAGGAGKSEQVRLACSLLKEAVEDLEEISLAAPGEGERICFEEGGKYEAVIILGGDGTIHECINGLSRLERRPVVGIIPGGTCNDFSRSLGIPLPLEDACRLIAEGEFKSVDIGKMNDCFFVNFFGIGLITETSENIDPYKKSMMGKISYYLSALETIREPQIFSYEIAAGEAIYTGEAVMIIALNGNYIGTKELPFQAEINDGLMELVIVREGGLALIREYLNMQRAQMTGEHVVDLEHLKVNGFTLTTSSPMKIDMDGEVYRVTPAECSVLPNHLQFIAGA